MKSYRKLKEKSKNKNRKRKMKMKKYEEDKLKLNHQEPIKKLKYKFPSHMTTYSEEEE